ncbi:MAG: GNAT family N-acetyltransferase [Chloroflexi bacterium]|nr:GNAT family N-acetyltransferase [Chloroflexota bacterium]
MTQTLITSRPYAGAADQAAIIDLVRGRSVDRVDDFPGIIDLQEMLGLEEIQASTHLWEDEEQRLRGYAVLDETNLICEVVPGLGSVLFGQMVTWAVERLRLIFHPEGEQPALEMSCREHDTLWLELLEQQGFVRQGEGAVHMTRSLRDPIPEPVLPEGFVIRPVAGEREVAAHVALHRAAWGTENMTVEYRLSMMRTPSYDRMLDLVAVAPDGRLAAYCMCYISPEANELSGRQTVYTDPLATHPDFQRQGLAKALMLAGMKLLYARGMETARLGTSSDNVAMQKAAEAAGFQLDFRTVRFAKPL